MESLADRGFVAGTGRISPDGSKFLLSIPKNASSFLGEYASMHGWTMSIANDSSCNWKQIEEMIVVLRDPIDRWVSGFAQYLITYIFYVYGPNTKFLGNKKIEEYDYDFTVDEFIKQYNQLSERLIFDNLFRFDDHVWPQHKFALGFLPGVTRKYFYMDHDFERKISDYLQFDLSKTVDIHRNSSENNQTIKSIQNFLWSRLELRPPLLARIKHVYHNDYELINQLNK